MELPKPDIKLPKTANLWNISATPGLGDLIDSERLIL